MSETVDDLTGSQQGNFPQTYSHVGLMNAAFRIARGRDLPDFLVSR
jgi:GH15 family glucan-1,4-alpha-glucosidase